MNFLREAIDVLKLPALILFFAGVYYIKFKNLENDVKKKFDREAANRMALDINEIGKKLDHLEDGWAAEHNKLRVTVGALAMKAGSPEIVTELLKNKE